MGLLLVILSCGMILAAPKPAFADIQDVVVTVTVPQCLAVNYTGGDVIFNLTPEDIEHGSVQLVNQGNLEWYSNVPDWDIYIVRTEWDTVNGDPNLELWLEIRYGPPPAPPIWVQITTTPGKWIDGGGIGSGQFCGIDWHLKKLNMQMQPGTYTCTVTWTIVPVP
jgi:hypothetical protein